MGRKRRFIKAMLKKGKRNPKELASCYGKIRYSTYEEAKCAANSSALSIIHAYKCQYGQHYHKGKRWSEVKA